MAKEQGLSLNPVKISGTCGRLMCCLKYEQDNYEYLLKITPKQGALVDTPEGRGSWSKSIFSQVSSRSDSTAAPMPHRIRSIAAR